MQSNTIDSTTITDAMIQEYQRPVSDQTRGLIHSMIAQARHDPQEPYIWHAISSATHANWRLYRDRLPAAWHDDFDRITATLALDQLMALHVILSTFDTVATRLTVEEVNVGLDPANYTSSPELSAMDAAELHRDAIIDQLCARYPQADIFVTIDTKKFKGEDIRWHPNSPASPAQRHAEYEWLTDFISSDLSRRSSSRLTLYS